MTTRSALASSSCMEDDKGTNDTFRHRVYLIRHGESLGQCAIDESTRRKDKNLLDCSLSVKGEQQALEIPKLLNEKVYNDIEYVLCSPLTRAVQTAILAFPNKPIIIHYELREIGTFIPENIPRPIEHVLQDIQAKYSNYSMNNIDYVTHLPSNWPKNHDITPKVIRRDKVLNDVFRTYIGKVRPARNVAVVCHYHVIRAALTNVSLTFATPTPRKAKRLDDVTLNSYQTPPPKLYSNNQKSIQTKEAVVSTTKPLHTTIIKDSVIKTPAKTPQISNQQRHIPPQTPSTTVLQPDIRPANAIPIKCFLNPEFGQLIISENE